MNYLNLPFRFLLVKCDLLTYDIIKDLFDLKPEKSGFLRALDFKSESFGISNSNKHFEFCSFDYPF